MATVKVRFLAEAWSGGHHWLRDDVASLDADTAQALIDARVAEPAKAKHPKSST